MYVSRSMRSMKTKFTVYPNGEGNYDENDMVELLNEIKNLNLLDAYKSKIECLLLKLCMMRLRNLRA